MDRGHRWLGVGHSTERDPHRAGREAAGRALRATDPALLIVFVSGAADPTALLHGIAEVCPGVPLIGCSSELLVTVDGAALHGVVVTALGGPGFTVRTAAGSCADGAQRQGGEAVARCGLDPVFGAAPGAPVGPDGGFGAHGDGGTGHRSHRMLVLLTDGWLADQEEILAGAYGVLGASIPMIGGSASPDPAARRPFLLHGPEVLTDAAVGAVVSSTGPLGFGIRHGWRRVGEPMIVTQSAGGRVCTLDDRPAVQAYLDRYDAPGPAYTDPAVFEVFAQSRPIGVRRRHGVEVRSVSSSTSFADGRLYPSGEVPEGALVWLMEGDAESAVAAAADACRDAVQALGGGAPLGLIAFDCVSRSHMLGERGTRREVRRMREHIGDAPLTGVYTWGEILRTLGMNGYHNQTLAVLAVG
ncbi:MAG TPA: FIST N-terminal domain-containing protein [Catenuloplanes sp.]|jgi:hypothetical protein